jgi:hypothetical protein
MDVVTRITACTVAAQTGLFVPLGDGDVCEASARRDGSRAGAGAARI